MTNIILCGGNGTRLWPISRTLMPKQFLKLFDDKSLFQLTLQRNSAICSQQLIVSNSEQYFIALDQLEELNKSNNKYLLEPIGRNTAAAIALACLALDPQEIVLVTPSDHLIKNEKEYIKVLKEAKALAQEDSLVTFGIQPSFAETGFGYIQAKPENDECSILNVELFHEKPDLQTAKKYIEENSKLSIQNLPLKFFWNSGMFCFKAGVFLDELKKYSPKIYETSKIASINASKGELSRIKLEDMLNIPEDSIDYAVMEKSKKVKVIPSDIGWSDVGSFDALHEELEKNENNNTKRDNLIDIDSKNNLVLANKKVALIDVNDLIVVATSDALLISKQGSSQKVKTVVKHLKKEDSQLPNIHLTAHRPWGTYTVLEDSPNYKIKRIVVKPKKRLSLQKHFHRNEHWVVVSGTAIVRVGDKEMTLRANESTYIDAGVLHRLENQGNIDLVLIEAQVGEYLGEDDIVRVEDDFERGC